MPTRQENKDLVSQLIAEKYPHLQLRGTKGVGTDLLVQNKTPTKTLSIRVKHSRNHTDGDLNIRSRGWWTFYRNNIQESDADLWVMLLYPAPQAPPDFIAIEPKVLLVRYDQLGRQSDRIDTEFRITTSGKCWETRNLGKDQIDLIEKGKYVDQIRDFTAFLNNWKKLEELM